jgi:hypothetical protein
MAAKKGGAVGSVIHKVKPKVKRPGVHAKTKQSSIKTSKNYVKPYRGQGR